MSMFFKNNSLLALAALPTISGAWILNSGIEFPGAFQWGRSISLNGAGDILAVATQPGGTIRVYEETSPKTWAQKGSQISSAALGSIGGFAQQISISDDGLSFVVGSPDHNSKAGIVQVWKWSGSDWIPKGSNNAAVANPSLSGVSAEYFGSSVDINNDGDVIVVAASGNSDSAARAGQVRVFKWTGSTWSQLGGDIEGGVANNNFGFSVAINGSGNIVAASTPRDNSNTGHVRAYQITGSTWNQLGSDIDGSSTGEEFGYDVDINHSGDVMVVGSLKFEDAGALFSYEWDGSSWSQRGETIKGGHPFYSTTLGHSVSISDSGNIIAGGAPSGYDNTTNQYIAGHTVSYQFIDSVWKKKGDTIYGDNNGDHFGWDVNLSNSGDRIAISAPMALNNSGIVKVLDFEG